jgi:hypothetical protein
VRRTADRSLQHLLQAIRHGLVRLGWLAPAVLLDEAKVWP